LSFIALLGAQLNIAVVVDGAASGIQRLQDMIDKHVMEATRCCRSARALAKRRPTSRTSSPRMSMWNCSTPADPLERKPSHLPEGNRIAARVAKHLGVKRWDRYRPASYFTRHKADLAIQARRADAGVF
jgi:hypothetical protein